jgi:hypothetical protein
MGENEPFSSPWPGELVEQNRNPILSRPKEGRTASGIEFVVIPPLERHRNPPLPDKDDSLASNVLPYPSRRFSDVLVPMMLASPAYLAAS